MSHCFGVCLQKAVLPRSRGSGAACAVVNQLLGNQREQLGIWTTASGRPQARLACWHHAFSRPAVGNIRRRSPAGRAWLQPSSVPPTPHSGPGHRMVVGLCWPGIFLQPPTIPPRPPSTPPRRAPPPPPPPHSRPSY